MFQFCLQVVAERLAHSLQYLRTRGLSAISGKQLMHSLHAGARSVINTGNVLELKEHFSERSKMQNKVD